MNTDGKLTITILEAAARLGISRNLAYESARTGKLPTIRLGARVLVPVAALEKLLASADGTDRPAAA